MTPLEKIFEKAFDVSELDGSNSPSICPALIFQISTENAIFCNVLKQWEKGSFDWEEALTRIIFLLEQHIKKMAEDPEVKKFVERNAFLPIPVLEKSLMPTKDKNATPLMRQKSLIQACYVLSEIQKDYLTMMKRLLEKSKVVEIENHE